VPVRARGRAAAWTVFGTVALAVLPVHAQQDGSEPALDTVVVEGHHDNAVGTSDAASEGTVTSKLVEDRPALRPGEVLEFVPGMIVTQHSGDGKANQYYLRGFNLDHGTDFATWVAGMPVNMRSHAHGQGYTDLNFLIPELVSRIDYRKGPYFADDGDFSSAGSARIGYLERFDRPIATFSLGQNGYQRLVGAGSTAAGPGTLLGAVELNHNDGPWDVPQNFRKLNAVARWSLDSGDDRFGLTAMGYDGRWTSTDQIPKRAVDQGLISRFGSLDPTDGGQSSRASLSIDWMRALTDGAFQLNAYAVRSRLDLFSNFTFFLAHPFDLGDPVNGDQFKQSEKRTMAGLNAARTWTGRLGDAAMVNKIGLQLRYDRVNPLGLQETVARGVVDTVREDDVKEGSTGLYAENSVQWTPWLRSVLGLRFDSYRFNVASDNPANSGKVSAHITSPKLSFILGPWAKTEFFANYGEGFHSNDARGTTTRVSPSTGMAVDPVTPLVKTRGGELGARTEIIPGLQSSIALWRLRLGSELVFTGDAGDTEPSRASKRQGVEWTNQWIFSRNLLLDLNLAASKARFTEEDPAGDYIPGSIDKVASMGLTLTDWHGWFGALQWRYFGPRPLIEDNSQRSASTSLAYLRLGRQLDPNTRLSLDVFNVFDRKASDIDYYYASRLAGEPAAGVNDIHFHPVEPRTLRVTLQAKF